MFTLWVKRLLSLSFTVAQCLFSPMFCCFRRDTEQTLHTSGRALWESRACRTNEEKSRCRNRGKPSSPNGKQEEVVTNEWKNFWNGANETFRQRLVPSSRLVCVCVLLHCQIMTMMIFSIMRKNWFRLLFSTLRPTTTSLQHVLIYITDNGVPPTFFLAACPIPPLFSISFQETTWIDY